MLNPQETDSQAALYIWKGLRLASSGRFRDAERFSESPESQVATYLQAQSYFAPTNATRRTEHMFMR
jgi:hypothetical protein